MLESKPRRACSTSAAEKALAVAEMLARSRKVMEAYLDEYITLPYAPHVEVEEESSTIELVAQRPLVKTVAEQWDDERGEFLSMDIHYESEPRQVQIKMSRARLKTPAFGGFAQFDGIIVKVDDIRAHVPPLLPSDALFFAANEWILDEAAKHFSDPNLRILREILQRKDKLYQAGQQLARKAPDDRGSFTYTLYLDSIRCAKSLGLTADPDKEVFYIVVPSTLEANEETTLMTYISRREIAELLLFFVSHRDLNVIADRVKKVDHILKIGLGAFKVFWEINSSVLV